MKYYIELARHHKEIKYFDYGILNNDYMKESETFYKGMEFTTMIFEDDEVQDYIDVIDNIVAELFNIS